MCAADIVNRVISKMEREGYRGRIVSSVHLEELADEISGRYQAGDIDEGFYREYLSRFSFEPPEGFSGGGSLIIVAVPQPQVLVHFAWKGKIASFVVPPTYRHATDEPVKALLVETLDSYGYRVARAIVPVKLMAVHSGLARYGRNNIAYVDGMGSFHRLGGGGREILREETALFMDRAPIEQLPAETVRKLEALSLTEYVGSLARNLGVLFALSDHRDREGKSS